MNLWPPKWNFDGAGRSSEELRRCYATPMCIYFISFYFIFSNERNTGMPVKYLILAFQTPMHRRQESAAKDADRKHRPYLQPKSLMHMENETAWRIATDQFYYFRNSDAVYIFPSVEWNKYTRSIRPWASACTPAVSPSSSRHGCLCVILCCGWFWCDRALFTSSKTIWITAKSHIRCRQREWPGFWGSLTNWEIYTPTVNSPATTQKTQRHRHRKRPPATHA